MAHPEISTPKLMAGFEGAALPDWITHALEENDDIAGVILFRRNFESLDQLIELTSQIRRCAPLPPLIAVDQEGGRVQRLRETFTDWPSMRKLASHNDPDLARRFGEAVGTEMAAAGINTVLAPVLCLDTQPGDHIADRSFGKNPVKVAEFGAAVIKGIQSAGALSCAKHFPGYGAVNEDSHEILPETNRSLEELSRTHLFPFQAAMNAKVDMMMVGHLINSAVDADMPATLSNVWMKDILRDNMGFDGVVMTDDLDMGAIGKTIDICKAIEYAAQAGADIALVCHNRENIDKARQTLRQIRDGSEHAKSVDRVALLRAQIQNNALDCSPDVIGCSEHRELAAFIEGGP